jgi:hypothetical protein
MSAIGRQTCSMRLNDTLPFPSFLAHELVSRPAGCKAAFDPKPMQFVFHDHCSLLGRAGQGVDTPLLPAQISPQLGA